MIGGAEKKERVMEEDYKKSRVSITGSFSGRSIDALIFSLSKVCLDSGCGKVSPPLPTPKIKEPVQNA